MRLRALTGAAVIAAIALASTNWHVAALGRPGITPVPCPTQEWQLGDPKFDALPGAKAFFGQYDGGIYKIEIPDEWNGELAFTRDTEPDTAGNERLDARASTEECGDRQCRCHDLLEIVQDQQDVPGS